MDPYFRKRPADGSDGSPPSEAWLFAQSLLGKPVPCPFRAEADARARREHLEWLAQISPEDARRVRGRLSEDVDIKAQQDLLEWVAEISGLREAEWDSSKHPRVPKGQSDGGQWVATGGSVGASGGLIGGTGRTQNPRAPIQLVAAGDATMPKWPTHGPSSPALPKVGSGVGAGAGAAAGVFAGGLLGGLRNAAMGAYWGRVPGAQAMPSIWAYELEKRVRAGKLSHDDAVAIFNTAMLGAEAQGFKPTGERMSAVHKSATDFLGKAESVYWARKADLKQIDYIAKKVGGLTDKQRDILHQWIRKQNPSLAEIEELAKQVKELYPNK